MRTPDQGFALAYFERGCGKAMVSGLTPGAGCRARWFDPRKGLWIDAASSALSADSEGRLALPAFPGGQPSAEDDWALSLVGLEQAAPNPPSAR